MHPEIQHRIFCVAEKPYCVWGWDLQDRNAQFIRDIDPDYFEYVALKHVSDLKDGNSQRAATAIRQNYYLCLETLFGLIGALIQAPDCVAGWVLKASTGKIRNVADALAHDRLRFPMKWTGTPSIRGFDDVARLTLEVVEWPNETGSETQNRFGKLWYRLAADFLDAISIAEYNSIKHGFRARAGGFRLSMGMQEDPSKPAPPDKMRDLGGSEFGSSFYAAEPVDNAPTSSTDPHFMLRRRACNWYPNATADRTVLAAISIANIRSFLSLKCGLKSSEVRFDRPDDPASFDNPWTKYPGVSSVSMDLTVDERQIKRIPMRELRGIVAHSTGVQPQPGAD
jgi:hypothetical protein